MNENYTHTETLIQYLDGELHGDQLEAVKKNIKENPALRDELENLQLAKEATKSFGLKNRIGTIHTEMMQELKESAAPKRGMLRNILPMGLRIAATFLVLMGLSAAYQYLTATPEKLFSENYKAFEPRVSRGATNSTLEDLYEKGDLNGLVQQFGQLKSPEAKDYFLAGNAYLSIHRPSDAINTFSGLEKLNQTNGTHFFEEDVEYFLALSYLSNQEPAKALPLFEKIHADPNHPYHSAVSTWFLSKLKHTIKS